MLVKYFFFVTLGRARDAQVLAFANLPQFCLNLRVRLEPYPKEPAYGATNKQARQGFPKTNTQSHFDALL
jgi:hypothetical protein